MFKENEPVVSGLITRTRLYQKNSPWHCEIILQLIPEWQRNETSLWLY